MKSLSSICLAAVIVCLIGSYLSFYSMGSLEHSMWEFFDPFITGPIIIISFLVLVVTWIVSLCLRKHMLWTTGMLVGFIALAGLYWYGVLPPPGCTVVYGIRNHVMKVCTLDDLRRFARSVHQDVPGIDVFDGDTSSLSKDRAVAYQKLQKAYPFLNWGIGLHPDGTVWEKDGAVIVEWGGALPGHWGFSVTVDGRKNDPDPDPDARILRMSDDIFFYHGD
ncbi:MAG TPA: hypothetical protein VGZ93_10655 [Candidatus Methylacidiphilales bacterium]|nr:hypothetical protein [Candidatus Methylacidiphilales bacterium]